MQEVRRRLQHPAGAAFITELPPEGNQRHKADHAEHDPRQLRLMERFSGIKQPAATGVTQRAAKRQPETAEAHVAAPGPGVGK